MNDFRIDLSIKQLDDVLSTKGKLDPEKVRAFLFESHEFVEKIDGVKITLWRNDKPYSSDYRENWTVAYKNSILYPEEFQGISDEQAVEDQGYLQHAMIFNHLERNHSEEIPRNREFFVEFALHKHTLMRKYQRKQMFLLGQADSHGQEIGGYLQTNPGPMIDGPDLGLSGPVVLLNTLPYQQIADPVQTYEELKEFILSKDSSLGGPIEGVVLNYNGSLFKIQQQDQTDKQARQVLRDSYRGEPEVEVHYWEQVHSLVDHFSPTGTIQDKLVALRSFVDRLDLPTITKRDACHVWNDIYTTGRLRLIRELPENQNGLLLGRFQPLTSAHAEIIRSAAAKHSILFVAVVNGTKTSKDKATNPFNYNLRKRLIEALGVENLVVIETPTGNIRSILNRIPAGISTVYCGTDRVESYQQAAGTDIKVEEIPRTNNVSGTSLRYAIKHNDKQTFEQLSDPSTHGFYEVLKQDI